MKGEASKSHKLEIMNVNLNAQDTTAGGTSPAEGGKKREWRKQTSYEVKVLVCSNDILSCLKAVLNSS